MKVMIADDEDKVCQLIYRLVDWDELEMEVVAIVHNGIEALEMIKKHEPDIVITDIRMPGYDGLEMIRRAKEMNENIDVIIISGYRHFDYAQNAIRYGVSDYLLKPIKKEELTRTLTKMRNNYLTKYEQLTKEEKFRITIQKDLDKLRAAFFSDILFEKKQSRENLTIVGINEMYHYSFEEDIFQIFIIKLDGLDYSQNRDRNYFEEKVLNTVSSRLKEICIDCECCFEGSRCYAVLNYKEDNLKIVRKAIKSILDDLLLQKELFESLKVTIGAGTVEKEISNIYVSCKAAKWATEQRLILGTNRIIEGIITNSNDFAQSKIFLDFNSKFISAVDKLDEKEITLAINNLRDYLKTSENVSGHEILQMGREALNLYLFCMRKNNFLLQGKDDFFDSFSLKLDEIGSMEDIFSYLIKVLLTSLRKAMAAKSQENNKPVREAKQFIQHQFMKQITLELVSDHVGFNASYFSLMFKKEAGITFSEYLMNVRMEKAKELLKETNFTVASICEEVGYSDLKSFTKVFAKHTNLKPNEYRKIYS